MKPARLVWTLAAAMGALMSIRSSANAQLVIGVVRDKANGAPIKSAKVQLLPDTGTASLSLPNTVTDSSGVFYIDVPKPGRYRLLFATFTSTFFSDPFPVTAGDVQHEFVLDVAGAQPYFEFQVGKQVLVRDAKVIYPPALRSAGIEGEVLGQFVVDTLGRAEMWTFRILESTNPAFTDAVRAGLPQMRFSPAEAGNKKVRELVQMPFFFHLGQQVPHDTTSLPWKGLRADP